MAYWILLVTILLISQVTTVPIGNGQLSDTKGSPKDPVNTEEQQLRHLDPYIPEESQKASETAQSTPKHDKNDADIKETNLIKGEEKQHGADKHPKESNEKMKTNQNLVDFTEEELEDSFDSILKDVLITLRDHPEIVRDIMEEEELEDTKQPPAKSDFQNPSPQLGLEPKKVEKKGGWRQHVPKFSKGSMSDSSEDDESEEENYYKLKYGSAKHSDDADHPSSEESEQKSEESGEKEEQGSQDSSRASRIDKSQRSSESSSQEIQPIKTMKRKPEKFEPTIDLTSLPEEGGIDDPVNAGTKKRNNVHRLPHTGDHAKELETMDELRKNFKNPFINPLPLFSPKVFHPLKDVEIQKYPSNVQLVPHDNSMANHSRGRPADVKNNISHGDKENENELSRLTNLEGKQNFGNKASM